jgi:hypothetical protein
MRARSKPVPAMGASWLDTSAPSSASVVPGSSFSEAPVALVDRSDEAGVLSPCGLRGIAFRSSPK